ncbi:MAG: sigma-70 family RNA polymerase sigma factor [Armatimonadota bacterium]|nr:sigma-70 family RNA polymerase sigma factor [Armatimonadota bacterium]
MTELQEEELIKRFWLGDVDAFTELVRRYRDAVYGYCYHKTGSFEDARDLAQETFIRAYTHLDQLRDPSSFGAWIRTIAGNLCKQWARRKSRALEALTEADAACRQQPKDRSVEEALATLPENERLVLVLHYIDGYTYADIARFLGLTEDAVRGRLHRGRERLRSEVLEMTQRAFEGNRLDEAFVVEAVNRAVREAHDTYISDKELSRRKIQEAQELLNKINTTSPRDPVAVGKALLELSVREFVLTEYEPYREHLNRARQLFEQAGCQEGIADCLAQQAYEALSEGDIRKAYDLFAQVEKYWKRRRAEDPTVTNYKFLACLRGIEAFGFDKGPLWDVFFQAGECFFARDDGQILYDAGMKMGGHGHKCPKRIPFPSGLTPLPLVLLRTEPQVGDTLRFLTFHGKPEESILETLSDTVSTPAGTFTNCARAVCRVFSEPGWTGDVIATRKLWFAPGVGIVRIAYQAAGETEDNSELVDFHLEVPSEDYLPLAVGNWWKWRWKEGEEILQLRTEIYREIVAQEGEKPLFAGIEYSFAQE